MHVVAIGDIGVVDGMMHIGDEAMFEQFLDQSRARGISEVVAISANPVETASRYGIESIARLGLVGDRAAMIARADEILFSTLAAGDPAIEVIDRIAGASRVVVTGAGNLASTWPVHIIERWVIAELARRSGVPFVVTGQTLGPALSAADAYLLSELLDDAALVGVRERASLRLADTLGVGHDRLQQTIDDASFLGLPDEGSPAAGTAPYCLVSFSTHVGDTDRTAFVSAAASLLDRVTGLGLAVRFLAHFGPIDGEPRRGDVVMHEDVASRMVSPYSVQPTGSPVEAARLARAAALVVSSRYHPAVFAAAGGVPTLGIAVDEYTTVKLRGALGAFGQQAVISGGDLVAGTAPDAVTAVYAARASIRAEWAEQVAARQRESDRWWDLVVGVLTAPA